MFNVKINYLKHNKNTTMERRKTLFSKVCTIEFIDAKTGNKDNVNSAPKLHKIKRNLKIDTLLEDTYVC